MAKPYYEEYTRLAMKRKIVFNHDVTIGFKEINEGSTIGICTLSEKWHEIDLDTVFWKKHSEIERKFLTFHELTHCFCNRDHDFGNGQMYTPLGWFATLIPFRKDYKSTGYFKDGCPMSIMAPVIATEDCLESYYEYYIDEMFNRCKPW